MADAFIYDAVRTPRGRGKADGALHTATTLQLAKTALAAIKDRNDIKPGQAPAAPANADSKKKKPPKADLSDESSSKKKKKKGLGKLNPF